MGVFLSDKEFQVVKGKYDESEPGASFTLNAQCYTDQKYLDVERESVFKRTWQWVCHVEKVRELGAYYVADVQGQSIAIVRDRSGDLRAFYNVCKHRAHHLLEGEGKARVMTCPYHAWSYNLDGNLRNAPHTEGLVAFDKGDICLDQVQVEEFCGFIYISLDPAAKPLSELTGNLAQEIMQYAPDVNELTFSRRLSFDIKANWKNVVDNFLECYHCPHAHKDFCTLLQFETYKVTTHGIYSSHMAKGAKGENSAYSVEGGSCDDHAVWWLWPNTCLMRYPGRNNFLVLNVIPVGPDRTIETYDFYFETAEPTEQEEQAIKYIRDVLQQEDIDLVESVQRGMNSPAFESGRIVNDPSGSGLSEHALHHFHGLLLDAYKQALK
ncbi:aromatic ring-hydroxylating oxygenase subunit alpha [Marinobacterium rhizophilum]|uniref:Ring-hydroxylating oxygenase subunit alpha n=1 Tax=Marinobacterium rhizophilum TaxID=420402 RepID=A0ABY5HL56_9GAMM|nr:ring-hydroxylating oxygenase subunit alpha [Marinobacterium rhizophilum]UTW13126.1 ring-hydroxylating oxygenase subunit alpha [Marinobacterium rhizophilum]